MTILASVSALAVEALASNRCGSSSGLREDAGHRDIGAADLGGDVAIEILRRDDLDRIGEAPARSWRESGYRGNEHEALFDHRGCLPSGSSPAGLASVRVYVML